MPTGVYERTEYHRKINSIAHMGQKHTEETKKKIGAYWKGKPKSEESKAKISASLMGHPQKQGPDSPKWKGDNIGYDGVHVWARKTIPKPECCPKCGVKRKLEISNIDHNYRRVVSDWEYLCYSCHQLYEKEHNMGNYKNE